MAPHKHSSSSSSDSTGTSSSSDSHSSKSKSKKTGSKTRLLRGDEKEDSETDTSDEDTGDESEDSEDEKGGKRDALPVLSAKELRTHRKRQLLIRVGIAAVTALLITVVAVVVSKKSHSATPSTGTTESNTVPADLRVSNVTSNSSPVIESLDPSYGDMPVDTGNSTTFGTDSLSMPDPSYTSQSRTRPFNASPPLKSTSTGSPPRSSSSPSVSPTSTIIQLPNPSLVIPLVPISRPAPILPQPAPPPHPSIAPPPTPSAPSSPPSPPSANTGPHKLVQDCSGMNFFSCWEFWTLDDPTHGQVQFVGQTEAQNLNLISSTPKSSIMRADYTTDLPPGGNRKTIRISSKIAVPIGSLMIADIIRMPFGCGTWPAWWTNGPNWPAGGEIDIVEGISLQTNNQMTLHTATSDCKRDPGAKTLGSLVQANADCNAHVNSNTGCSYLDPSSTSYGQGFNKAGGGVWATLFVPSGISIWYFPRASVPSNILSPDYKTWGTPSATWPSSSCAMSWFAAQTMIFDNTLCGDWAGAPGVWNNSPCAQQASTCSAFVQKGANWVNALWEVGYVKTYAVSS